MNLCSCLSEHPRLFVRVPYTGSYLILKIKKKKIILIGASLATKKEPNADIGEIVSE